MFMPAGERCDRRDVGRVNRRSHDGSGQVSPLGDAGMASFSIAE